VALNLAKKVAKKVPGDSEAEAPKRYQVILERAAEKVPGDS
jgi:hypothetical protein